AETYYGLRRMPPLITAIASAIRSTGSASIVHGASSTGTGRRDYLLRWARTMRQLADASTHSPVSDLLGLVTQRAPVIATHRGGRARFERDQSGYSSLRQARGSSDSAFGVRLSRNEWYGATNGSGAITV